MNYLKSGDSNDSGYPTTSLSSQQTQPSGVNGCRKAKSPSAEERRKMFGNKNKSSSFYDISPCKSHLSIDSSSFSTDFEHEGKLMELRRHAKTNYYSIDSDNYCLMCRRDRRMSQAETYSCESELNHLHRRDRNGSGESGSGRKCNCKRCRHRRKSHCRKHIRQFSRDIDELDMNYRHNLTSLKRCSQRFHKQSSDKVYYTAGPSRSFREYSNAKLSTSTESDACDCSKRSVRSRRKCYKRVEHYSDGSYTSRHKNSNFSSIRNLKSSWELCREQTYRNKMIDSYLENVHLHGYSLQDPYLSVDIKGHSASSNCSYADQASADSCQSRHTSLGSSSKPRSPLADLPDTFSKRWQIPRNQSLPEVEVITRNNDEEPKSKSLDKLDNTPQSSSGSDKTINTYKDSAYQTKQSSVDRYNSLKDLSNTSTTKNKCRQAGCSNR